MRVLETDTYAKWYGRLKDRTARARIDARITQCKTAGKPVGDLHPVGNGVSELRFHFGPGYRIYFAQKDDIIMLLLAGGDKGTQQKDIKTAQGILHELIKEGQW